MSSRCVERALLPAAHDFAFEFNREVRVSPAFHFAGGTYSFGLADPSPKKNCSNCLTMTS
jgi:hypothetical protein